MSSAWVSIIKERFAWTRCSLRKFVFLEGDLTSRTVARWEQSAGGLGNVPFLFKNKISSRNSSGAQARWPKRLVLVRSTPLEEVNVTGFNDTTPVAELFFEAGATKEISKRRKSFINLKCSLLLNYLLLWSEFIISHCNLYSTYFPPKHSYGSFRNRNLKSKAPI